MRSIARQENWEESAAPAREVLARRLLAEGVASALRGSPSRFVLVVSAREGDGKSHLFRTLAAVLGTAEPDAWKFLDADGASRASPGDVPTGCRVILDGAALLDGDGGIRLDDSWMGAIDGALIVLLAGRTTEDEVAHLRARLDALEIPPVGVVWNDRDDRGLPSLLGALRRRADAVRALLPGRRVARTPGAAGSTEPTRPAEPTGPARPAGSTEPAGSTRSARGSGRLRALWSGGQA